MKPRRPTGGKPAARTLRLATVIGLFFAAASMPLFAQSLFVVEGNLPTPALPPRALTAAIPARGDALPGQPSTATGSASPAIAGPQVSKLEATGTAEASQQPSGGKSGVSQPTTPRPPEPPAPVAAEKTQATQPSGVLRSSGPNIVPDEVGYASWYGSRFHGRLTASGQIYNMNEMTAANRTLPFGTRVLVTDLENGKSVVVTINDRGPFVGGRIIDLSRAAAEAIGLTGQGVAKVRLHVIKLGNGQRVPQMGPAIAGTGASAPASTAAARPAGAAGGGSDAPAGGTIASASQPVSGATPSTSRPAAALSPPSGGSSVVVQVGAFRDLTNAVRLKEFLAQNGFDPIYEKWENFTRVVLLPVPQNEVATLRRRLEKIGITSILVRHN